MAAKSVSCRSPASRSHALLTRLHLHDLEFLRHCFSKKNAGLFCYWIIDRIGKNNCRSTPLGQVVYGEKDPRTGKIRYIGRTSNATRRHAEHMRNVSPEL